MIIYNPNNIKIMKERLIEAENILNEIPARSVFISGSFLFKKGYEDIDVFVITRSSKKFKTKNKKVKITKIAFNSLHSLFYHSVSKSCVSKNILPTKKLRATISDCWDVVNEAVPAVFNEKNFKKDIRNLVLYTEYFLNGIVLDSYGLSEKVDEFSSRKQVLFYLANSLPKAILRTVGKDYVKRFFYTQAGVYKETLNYESHKYLYDLSHMIIKETCVNG
jgi:hypothetical protein